MGVTCAILPNTQETCIYLVNLGLKATIYAAIQCDKGVTFLRRRVNVKKSEIFIESLVKSLIPNEVKMGVMGFHGV